MSYTVIIPARYASTRLPGKPLLDIAGQPMIQHVWRRAGESQAQRVVIATDDERIEAACKSFDAEVCMTSPDHESGTDRLQEVVAKLGLEDNDIVVNVQGDEPLLPAKAIEQVADNLAAHPDAGIATLVEPITDMANVTNPNVVKAVLDQSGYALYFSRAPVPWCRDEWSRDEWCRDEWSSDDWAAKAPLPASSQYWRHIGIYAYRVGFLHQFVRWPMGQLEGLERLEQLRALENGVRIHVAPAAVDIPGGVDTEADLNAVRKVLEAGQ